MSAQSCAWPFLCLCSTHARWDVAFQTSKWQSPRPQLFWGLSIHQKVISVSVSVSSVNFDLGLNKLPMWVTMQERGIGWTIGISYRHIRAVQGYFKFSILLSIFPVSLCEVESRSQSGSAVLSSEWWNMSCCTRMRQEILFCEALDLECCLQFSKVRSCTCALSELIAAWNSGKVLRG